MISYIRNKFDTENNISLKDKSFENIIAYLEKIIDYSIVNKDIKTFLLFLYLHDTLLIANNENYNNWRVMITYEYFYEISMVSLKDLEHYETTIKDDLDERIYDFLKLNLQCGKNLLKKNSWVKFSPKIIKTYLKCLTKTIILYNRILKIRYAPPNGKGYLECLESWKINSSLNNFFILLE